MKKITTEVIKKTHDDIKLNIKLLLIWGTGVGGVMLPLNQYITQKTFEINKFQIYCVLCAIIVLFIDETRKYLGEKYKLKYFLETINTTIYNVISIIAYSLIIPIIRIVWDMYESNYNDYQVKEIFVRLLFFVCLIIFCNFVKEIVSNLLNKIFQNET